ncbi:hypothetical protein HK100_011377 [Physocladia obscura]|uniref:NADP-dependent oxidoreductase domain-containing protein n=1 Tax=Physocladia obscura TaxID=109957 RepID=A0AAD5T1B9_9FUNG|nr:hypothetical protein HK100_011377 [Physocladia obscura]
MATTAATILLNDGTKIPKLAYGTGTKWFKGRTGSASELSSELVESILVALRAGFTHIDTAEAYGTEPEVGRALELYFAESGKTRADVYITTKVSPPPTNVHESLTNSLARLGPSASGYVDLYLIHQPFWDTTTLPLAQVWQSLESLVLDTKQTRSIGVSNFRIAEFDAIKGIPGLRVAPAVNQIEYHAYSQSRTLSTYLSTADAAISGVTIAAYGPLQPLQKFADVGSVKTTVERIAAVNGLSASQVLLAWGWAKGTVQVTTSSNEQRLKEAVAALNVTLTQEEVDEISASGGNVTFRKFGAGRSYDD